MTLQSTMSTNSPDFPVTSADNAPVSDNLPEFSVISADDVPVPENIPEYSVISADDVPVPENLAEFSVISADAVPVPENLPEFSVTSADDVPVPKNLPEFSVTSADAVPVPDNLPEFSVISSDDAPANLPNSYSVVDEFPSDSTSAPPIHPLPGPSSAGTVPSPFKKHFFYQSKDMNKDTKRKHKEKLPAITFGDDYRTYLRLKMEKKENIEKQKLERANERKRKKEERDALKEKKKSERDLMKRRKSKQATKPKKFKRKLSLSSSSSDTSANVTSGDDIEDDEGEEDAVGEKKSIPPKKAVGEYIIVKYDGKFYPGLVLEVLPSRAKISAMTPSGKLWKWPLRPDVLYYEWDAVITSIEEPTKTSKTRDLYNVPEILHYNYD